MKSKSSQVICARLFIPFWIMVPLCFFFFKTGRSSYCQVCRLPISIERSTAICFLFLSWRFSATQSFQTCQFFVAPSSAIRSHNTEVSIGFQELSLHVTLKFYLIYIFSTNLHCLQWSARFVGGSLILTFDVPSVTLFTDFIRYYWNQRLI